LFRHGAHSQGAKAAELGVQVFVSGEVGGDVRGGEEESAAQRERRLGRRARSRAVFAYGEPARRRRHDIAAGVRELKAKDWRSASSYV